MYKLESVYNIECHTQGITYCTFTFSILSLFQLALWCPGRLKVTCWWLNRRHFMCELSSEDWADCLGWLISFGDCTKLVVNSFSKSLRSIIYTVDVMMDTVWDADYAFCCCLSKWTVFILDVLVWLSMCVPTCSSCMCIDKPAKQAEVPQSAQTHQSSPGNNISS